MIRAASKVFSEFQYNPGLIARVLALIFHDNTHRLQSCPRDQRPSQRRGLRPTPRIDTSPSSSDSRCSRQPNSRWTRPSECKFVITSCCARSSVTRGACAVHDAVNEPNSIRFEQKAPRRERYTKCVVPLA